MMVLLSETMSMEDYVVWKVVGWKLGGACRYTRYSVRMTWIGYTKNIDG